MLHWNLEYERVGWQEPVRLGAAEQRRRIPEFGLAIIPSDRMEKTGTRISAQNLRIWEPGPPKLLPLCSWAAVERSCEAAGAQKREVASAEAPGGSAGGPQPPCRLPDCRARCSAPFRGGLSGNWGPEEFMVCIYMFFRAWTPFRHGGGDARDSGV